MNSERSIQTSFIANIYSVACRGRMWYGSDPSLEKLDAFIMGYALAIDQVGGRTIINVITSFSEFMHKKVNSDKPLCHWREVIRELAGKHIDKNDMFFAGSESERIFNEYSVELFKKYWNEFSIANGYIDEVGKV